MTIKAIETHYKGFRFRSRLEARWAVFFDVLGVPWRYELDGFELAGVGKTERYLPDFFVGFMGAGHTWFEIKPYIFDNKGYTPDVRRTLKVMTELCYMPVKGVEAKSCAGYIAAGEPSTSRIGILAVPLFHDGSWAEPGRPVIGAINAAHARLAVCPMCHNLCFFVEATKDDPRLQALCGCIDQTNRSVFVKPQHAKTFLEAPNILLAVEASRAARFEHGDTPKVQRGKPKK